MKKLFSLSWFKSEKQKLYESLVVEEQQLKVDRIRLQLEKESEKPIESPFLSTKFVNNTLTVVLKDGSILSKPDATIEDFRKIRDCKDEQEIINVLASKDLLKDIQQDECDGINIEKIIEGMGLLKQIDDFELKEGSVYLKGINRSLPALLIDRFTDIISKHINSKWKVDTEALLMDDEYVALKRFFMWCCLNPRAEVADKLYDFLQRNGMKITKQGFFVALRNVVNVRGEDSALIDAISNAYNKVRAVWKKKASDYEMYKNNEGEFIISNKQLDYDIHIGNLEELYLNLPNMKENRYTDNWTKTFDIRIGQVVSMPVDKCSWSTNDCAEAGLHFAGHTAPYVLCGDTSVFTLHNPMKVVGIGEEKGRCYEYLPFMTTTVEEADQIMNSEDFDFLQLDEEYAIHELKNLEEKVKEGFAAESKKHEFNLPQISTKEINIIINSLEEMKSTIDKRITKF